MLTYKSIPFRIKEVADGPDGGWEVAGLASTFGGSPDSYGDIVVKGAFLDSIAARPTKFLFEHAEPIGKQLHIEETDEGLFGRWTITDTRAGVDAHKLIKAGVLDSLSIGFMTVEDEWTREGIRLLKKVDLFEVSCVAIPANRNAVITDVKSAPFLDHSSAVRIAVEELIERMKAGSALRLKDGRPLSQARIDQMTAVSGSLRSAAEQVDALLVPPPAPDVINVGAELRRRRLYAAGVLERPT